MKANSGVLISLLTAGFLTGCEKLGNRKQDLFECVQQVMAQPTSPVLARVGDETVTEAEFHAHLRQAPISLTPEQLAALEFRKDVLKSLITKKLTTVAAQRLKLDRGETYYQ